MNRRTFLKLSTLAGLSTSLPAFTAETKKPNLLFVFADQWRAQATGYMGDPNAITPHLDRFAAESVNLVNAVSTCPVCSPFRGSLMTGQYPLTHGVFMNDVQLPAKATSIAETYNEAGYHTGYIGKWHLDGRGRSSFIPRERRQGFQFWKALECTHDYNNSYYYADENKKLKWDGYDAQAQTKEAQRYIQEQAKSDKPFALFLSWGPPHAPYHTAPEKYRKLYVDRDIELRDNVPDAKRKEATQKLRGYYAHITALDDCFQELLNTLKECGLDQNTIVVFTSDHGDMLLSQGRRKKQQPYDESIRVPFLIRYPEGIGSKGKKLEMLFGTPDIMPTMLGLSNIAVPDTVEGQDFSPMLTGKKKAENEAALIMCPAPFGQWQRKAHGGREYRGIRTKRYTYTRDLNGPWMLFDNKKDPFQQQNLCGVPKYAKLQQELDQRLDKLLAKIDDRFLPAGEYIKKWGYPVDETGTVPYTN